MPAHWTSFALRYASPGKANRGGSRARAIPTRQFSPGRPKSGTGPSRRWTPRGPRNARDNGSRGSRRQCQRAGCKDVRHVPGAGHQRAEKTDVDTPQAPPRVLQKRPELRRRTRSRQRPQAEHGLPDRRRGEPHSGHTGGRSLVGYRHCASSRMRSSWSAA